MALRVSGMLILVAGCLASATPQSLAAAAGGADALSVRPRVAILSDIGNEPDDQMSMVRLLLYSNEFDLVALIPTTSTWQRSSVHPETMHALIRTYGEVRPSLLRNAAGWPTAQALDALVASGQTGYGMGATGPGRHTAGSDELRRAMQAEDSRPLWICLWGGANTLAQALIDLRSTVDPLQLQRIVGRLHVYSISDQDDAGPWIRQTFPGLSYIVWPSRPNGDSYYTATWSGISGDAYYRNCEGADSTLVTNAWLDRNIRAKGPLGQAYPRFEFIMEGDTPSFLNLIDNGLDADRSPDWGGWGGRYSLLQPYGEAHAIWTQGGDEITRTTTQDAVIGVDGRTHASDQATIWRWREAYQDDFAARMDWTIHDFAHANHAPLVVVNGSSGTAPVALALQTGRSLTLDAAGTRDPDGNPLTYHWFLYPEAGLTGTHGAQLRLEDGEMQAAKITAISACPQTWIPLPASACQGDGVMHVILAVSDNGTPRLTSYRRVVVRVSPAPLPR